jgi:hypothetical protein
VLPQRITWKVQTERAIAAIGDLQNLSEADSLMYASKFYAREEAHSGTQGPVLSEIGNGGDNDRR